MTKTTTAPPAPSDPPVGHVWYRGPGERFACAFKAGPGWMRSACGDVWWSIALIRVREGHRIRRCPGCVVALTVGPLAGPAQTAAGNEMAAS